MSEPREIKIRRLHMRSIRRGIKEMDLIFTAFATTHLPHLSDDDLDRYDALLAENDHDILSWVMGQTEAPAEFAPLMKDVIAGADGIARK